MLAVPAADGFVPYWAFDDQTAANLDIANRSPKAATLGLTALIAGRYPVALGEIALPAQQVVRVAVHERIIEAQAAGLIDGAYLPRHGAEIWGALLLHGKVETISAWLLMENRQASLSLNTMMARRGEGSESVVAQWWLPTPETRVDFAVQNLGSVPTAVRAAAVIDGVRHETTSRALGDGESARFELVALAKEWGISQLPEAGQLRLTAEPGAKIVARTFTADAQVGFSSPLMTHDLDRRQGYELQTPGVPLATADPAAGFPPGTVFHPMLLVSNTTEESLVADVYLQAELFPDAEPVLVPVAPADGAGPQDSIPALPEAQVESASFRVLPPQTWGEVFATALTLNAGETRIVDLLAEARRLELDVSEIGVRVDARGSVRPGSLVADLISVDETLTYSFFDPMFDTAIARTSRTEVSFELTGSKTAHLLFKNAALEEPANAWVRIYFQDAAQQSGTYDLHRRLAPMELWRIDIEHLRDARIPDDNGQLLPEKMVFGFATASTSGHVLGANPTFDPVFGTCGSCETENPPVCETTHELDFRSCLLLDSVEPVAEPNAACPGGFLHFRKCFYEKEYPCGETFTTIIREGDTDCAMPAGSCAPILSFPATEGTYTRIVDRCGGTPAFCDDCVAENHNAVCIFASP